MYSKDVQGLETVDYQLSRFDEMSAELQDRLLAETLKDLDTEQANMTKLGELEFFTCIHRSLREVFPVVAAYQTFISCFGTPWGFITAT